MLDSLRSKGSPYRRNWRVFAERDCYLTFDFKPTQTLDGTDSFGRALVAAGDDRRVEIEYFDVRGLDIIFEDRETDLQPDF